MSINTWSVSFGLNKTRKDVYIFRTTIPKFSCRIMNMLFSDGVNHAYADCYQFWSLAAALLPPSGEEYDSMFDAFTSYSC